MPNLPLKKWLTALLIALPLLTAAALPAWQILPTESTLTFTATQNDAPVTGQFSHFTGDVHYDPNQLNQSQAKIIIDINSITSSYNELVDTLKAPEWLNTKLFPQAIFQSSEFMKTGDKTFQVKGTLTIRDKTAPVVLTCTQEEYTSNKTRITGSTTIKRTAFGVGQGEWADTKAVKDDVRINFSVTAIKK